MNDANSLRSQTSEELIQNLKLCCKSESDVENIFKQLSNLEFFSYYYSQNKFQTLIRECILSAQYTFVQSGQYIFKQGEISDLFYILIDGIVQKQIVTYKNSAQTKQNLVASKNINYRRKMKSQFNEDEKSVIILKIYYQGDSFGEFQTQGKELRKYSILCLTDCHLLAINKETYFNFFAYQEKKRLLSVLEELKKIPYFNNWTLTEIKRLYNRMEIKTFSINSVVFQEGDPSNYFYIVKQGDFMYQKSLYKNNVLEDEREQGLMFQNVKYLNNKSKKLTNILLLSKMQTIGETEILEGRKGMQFSLVCNTSIGQLYQLKKQDFIDYVLSENQNIQEVKAKVQLQKEEMEKIMSNINQSYNAYKDFIFKDETIEENLRREDQYKSLSVSSNKWKTIADEQNLNQSGLTLDKKSSTFKDYFKMNLQNTDSNLIQTPREESQQKLNGRSNLIMETPKKAYSAQQSRVFDNSHISSHQSLVEQLNEQDSQLIGNHINEKQISKLTPKFSQSHTNTPKASNFQHNYYISSPQSQNYVKQPTDFKAFLPSYVKNIGISSVKNSIFNQHSSINTQKNDNNHKNITFTSLINESKNYQINALMLDQANENDKKDKEQNKYFHQDYAINYKFHSHNSSLADIKTLDQEMQPIKVEKRKSERISLTHQQIKSRHQMQQSQSQKQFQQNNMQQNHQQKETDQEQKNQENIQQSQMKRAQSAYNKKAKITKVENSLHNRLRFKFYQRIKDQERNPEGMKMHIFEDVIQKLPYKKTPHLKLRPHEIMNKSSDAFDKTKFIKQEIQYQKTQSMQELNNFLHYPISVRTQATLKTQQPSTKLTTTDTFNQFQNVPQQNKYKRKRPVSMCNLRKLNFEIQEQVPSYVDRLYSTKEQHNKSQSISINALLQTQHNSKLINNFTSNQGSTQNKFINNMQQVENNNTENQQQSPQKAQTQSNEYVFKYFMPTSKRTHINDEGYKFSQVQNKEKQKSVAQINTSIPEKEGLFISQTKSCRNLDFKPCLIEEYSKTSKQSYQNQKYTINQFFQKGLKHNLAIHQLQSKLEAQIKHPLQSTAKSFPWQTNLASHKKLDSSVIKPFNQTFHNIQ
ncbi:cyclic nucleotide-binding domain protein (macronuclear) [Tetrahymena thermophila SB210]|uniref:Cyclic nucleotide-binding domain protein n=1 Tax=Tetrahymena thermophila (strain SB210) TaxID=312017 RepID=Q237J5_TETTS|nr:cyclic nucleotide-binding domain protein [Tetrahymena thermophila SB210]EAR92746.1 cyclic nucleotide-binding domain protein [Tetrahymena thermophila SB210]|eukprot:XP_001012991.1 cyclic nucleotide-binding domain protein [Tetrahymena thermophila SB210]